MSTIKSSTTLTTAYSVEADTTGTLVFQTGATPTTAVTIGTNQSFNFSATGQRITGDFSNATVANRVMFQTSTANSATAITIIPNGTSAQAQFTALNSSSDPSNASGIQILANASEARVQAANFGTGTSLPMTFYTGGSERMRVDTSGNVLIGSSTANAKLYSYATSGTTTTLGRFEAAIGSYTGTSLIAANTLGASSSFNLFSCITDSDGDAGGPVTQFLVRGDGNVGIGTSSPTEKCHIYASSGNSFYRFQNAATGSGASDGGFVGIGGSGDVYLYNYETSATIFATNNAERMRIDSSGNLLVGTTSNSLSTKVFVSGSIGAQQTYGPMFVSNENNTDNVGRGSFNFQRGGTLVGQIVTTNSTCAYNSVSDYRLKENIAPMTGALAKVSALKPCTYTWKSDGSDGQGFIAHELQEVVPDCVTGEKDAVDAEGNPQYQGIDTSFLVATLTAAIQELKALVDTQASTITQLQADVAALKGTS